MSMQAGGNSDGNVLPRLAVFLAQVWYLQHPVLIVSIAIIYYQSVVAVPRVSHAQLVCLLLVLLSLLIALQLQASCMSTVVIAAVDVEHYYTVCNLR